MKIVGVGVGPGMLTVEAVKAIQHAEVIYGSKRAIELAAEHICCETKHIKDYSRLHELPSTGCPKSPKNENI